MSARAADGVWRGAVAATVVATIAMNVVANALPLFGRTTAAVSDAYPTPFTPAGYVFAIWGVIYLGLIVYSVWQFAPAGRSDPRVRAAAPWVIAAGVLNVAWLFAWHADRPVLATLPIVGLLIAVGGAYETLRAGPSRGGVRFAAQVPFGIYFGWLSVATIANVAVAGTALGWDGAPLTPEAWTGVLVVIATGLGIRMLQARGEWAFALVLIWAFVGIAVAVGLPSGVAFVAAIASALLAGGVAGRALRRGGGPAGR